MISRRNASSPSRSGGLSGRPLWRRAASRAARRSTASRFFGDDFKRNGTWLGGPSALLMGTLPSRKGAAEIALRLTDVSYNPSASTVVFRAEQIDPVAAKTDKNSASARLLRSSGGVVDACTAQARNELENALAALLGQTARILEAA